MRVGRNASACLRSLLALLLVCAQVFAAAHAVGHVGELSALARLDRDTSGLLLFTDDGALLHRIISPKAELPKVYDATLAHPLRGDEAALFASGTLMLESEQKPLLPAELETLAPQRARLTLHEGRYHQVRRMFAAVGNHVEALHRSRIGGLGLGDLPEGQWRQLSAADLDTLFGSAE